ncbi:MAG: hypothetical protein A2156_04400 [Deltaproteobacteria bacterium RBG_16_48_10]|nr:MAG: hypothetical protein A2156_04400 [Deltaproteobacteria bacterium RBG_16_48_10]
MTPYISSLPPSKPHLKRRGYIGLFYPDSRQPDRRAETVACTTCLKVPLQRLPNTPDRPFIFGAIFSHLPFFKGEGILGLPLAKGNLERLGQKSLYGFDVAPGAPVRFHCREKRNMLK